MSDGNWMQDAVRAFHLAMGHPAPAQFDPDGFRLRLRAELIFEEARETIHALGFELAVDDETGELGMVQVAEPDWPAVADGLCDLTYVTLGAAVEAGFSLSPFFHEVHRSNMLKVGGGHREDGKQLKPEGWEPPRITQLWQRVLARAGRA